MTPDSDIVLAALRLRAVDPELFDLAWEADTQYCPWPKAYGGDMVAQAAAAAMLSVTDGKALHSMHSYFMRPVDIGASVRYEVEVLRDGRGYATRQVRGMQNGKPVYVCIASFAQDGGGASFAVGMPDGVPAPETLRTSAEVLGGVDSDAARYWASGRSFDIRHVPGPLYLSVEGEQTSCEGVWVRAFSPLPGSVGQLAGGDLHRAALAYVCDYTIIEPTLRRMGLPWATEGLVTASLDHAMWFHRPARVDEWLFYAQEAVSAQQQRSLGRGHFFTAGGELIATVVQEAMVRPPR